MGLVKIEIDTKDITGMINSLKKVINYFEELQKFTNHTDDASLEEGGGLLMRRFIVGDIHGNHKALKEVLKKVKFDHDNDFLIIIGDVVDGYNCSYEVVEELIKVKNKVFVIGNHDQFFMSHIANGWAEDVWLRQGGVATRESYKSNGWMYSKFPDTHKEFFNSGVFWHEMDGMMFVHGGFDYPTHPKDTKNIDILTWDRSLLARAANGLQIKEWSKVFVGHTTTENIDAKPWTNKPKKGMAKIINVDCGAGWKGRLCLWDIDTDEYVLSKYADRKLEEIKNKNEKQTRRNGSPVRNKEYSKK